MKEPSEKQKYFTKVHTQLAKKYEIPLSYVNIIRSMAITKGFSREEAMDFLDERYKKYKEKETPKEYLKPLFNLLEDMSDTIWKRLTRPTKLDRQKSALTSTKK